MDEKTILKRIQQAVKTNQIKISLHAEEEAVAEEISRKEIVEVFANSKILENYPDWWLGPCCLLRGKISAGRDIHLVISYESLPFTIIPVYEPKPPKWLTPTQRGATK